jgi:hypothetical protein
MNAMMMPKVEGWEDADGGSYVLRGGQLLPATDEVLAEAAHHAMLLAQGAERAIRLRDDEVALGDERAGSDSRPPRP